MSEIRRIEVEPDFTLQCYVDDFLWPWEKSIPVVMVHGFARSAMFWQKWIPTLATTYRVYRPELRGFGGSDVPPIGYKFDGNGIMDDLIKVLDQCGIERAHFVGESSGGVFDVLFAHTHPDRVASLVLCDTPVKGSTATTPKLREIYSLGLGSAGEAMIKYGIAEWCKQTLEYRLDVKTASPELQAWYISEMGKTPAHVGAALNDLVRTTPSLAPLAKDIKAPVLFLGGTESMLSGTQLEAMAAEFPNGKLKKFPGYGHAVNVLVPEECAKAAVEFWSTIE